MAIAVAGALLCVPAAANATIVEIGSTTDSPLPAPSCPGSDTEKCQVVTRTTAYQVQGAGTKSGLTTVPKDGYIVAWTVSLSQPNATQVSFFSDPSGADCSSTNLTNCKDNLGPPSAGISVLRPGAKRKLFARTVSASPVIALTPYLGKTVQIPLAKSIYVKKGRIIALNVPTWAPALALNLDKTSVWRAARKSAKCGYLDTDASDVLLANAVALGSIGNYTCDYQTSRLTYSVTMITAPDPLPTAATGTTTPTTSTTVEPTTAGRR